MVFTLKSSEAGKPVARLLHADVDHPAILSKSSMVVIVMAGREGVNFTTSVVNG